MWDIQRIFKDAFWELIKWERSLAKKKVFVQTGEKTDVKYWLAYFFFFPCQNFKCLKSSLPWLKIRSINILSCHKTWSKHVPEAWPKNINSHLNADSRQDDV